MSFTGSVTQWIVELQAGEELALEKVRQRYWPFMMGLAKKKLAGVARRAEDEEDVAQEAFWGFYRSLKEGRLPKMQNRNDLLAVLTLITVRKAASQVERVRRTRRANPGQGQIVGESALDATPGASSADFPLEQVADAALGPEAEVQARDTYQQFMTALPESHREVAQMWLAGYSHAEIAKALDCSIRTIDRKVKTILEEWQAFASQTVDEEPE